MRFRDLGVIEGEVICFGGPYSNLQATEAVLAQGRERGATMICTGDVVAYCARPAETVALIRAAGVTVVAGNCERQLAAGAADCGCGFEEGSACDLLSAGWFAHADREVDAEARGWMGELPDMIGFTHAGSRWAVIHGGLSDVSRFLWEVSPQAAFAEEVALIRDVMPDVTGVIAGHSGLPFRRHVAGVMWVNAGVIGMPPHDGGQAGRYAVLSVEGVILQDLTYDAAGAFADMQEAGLTQGYERALLSGIWPSQDVLPEGLRRSDSG